MRNAKRWLAFLLAASMAVSAVSPGFGENMGLVQAAEIETAAEEAVVLNEQAVPRYSSIRIKWNAKSGHTYTIARSDAADGVYEDLKTDAAGPEWIDENAGTGKIRYYKITDNGDGKTTAVFSNTEATGIEALKEKAEFSWVNDGETVFDGNTALFFSGDDIKEVKDISAGTILCKGYQNTGTGSGDKVFLGIKGGDTGSKKAYFGERSNNAGKWGIAFGDLIPGWNLAYTPSFAGTESSKHASGYVSPKKEDAAEMFVSIDGNFNKNPNWTSASYGGFMERCKVNEISIGGFGTKDAVTNGWSGGIDYVLITSEVLSQEEVKAITNAKPELEPEKTALNAKAVPGYSSIKLTWDAEEGENYTISRSATEDGAFTELSNNVTASPYVDDTVEAGENWYYQIKNNQSGENAIFTAKMPAGIDALKKYAQFQWVNDGSIVFDGSKGLHFTGDQIAAVKELTSGTIITKGYLKSAPTGNAVLLGFKKDTATGFFGTRSARAGQWGWGLGSLITNWNASLDNTSLAGTSSSKHVTAYVSPETSEKKPMLFSFDGGNKTNTGWTSDSFGGFMKRMGITEISIGNFNPEDSVAKGWNGGIDYVYITDEVLTQAEIDEITKTESIDPGAPVVPGANITEMFDNAGDNTWVFTGGEDVQGGFSQVLGARNYIGQFEEYIRWTKTAANDPNRQRYTINTAKSGQTLKDVIDNWDSRVTEFNPRAVAFMAGKEEYSKDAEGIENFKENLKQFIEKALALRGGKGFAVIQKPYVRAAEAENKKIEAYCEAIDAVVAEYQNDAAKLGHIVVVDHYTKTKAINNFTSAKLNADGTLNKWGHWEIGKELCEATIKMTDGYPANIAKLDQKEEPQADVYLKAQPQATASEHGLNVVIPAEAEGNEWRYTLKIGDVEIKDSASGRTFAINDLPAGKAYTLTVQTKNGKTQLMTVAGHIIDGEQAVKKTQELNGVQKKLQEKMAENEPMTWLFMGDSITHGAMWTNGYDSIAQSFEKFLKEDLDRKDDVVVNTAVSGATAATTLTYIEQRLNQYKPDVVSIMLGTNDCTAGNAENYEKNLKDIIQKAKAKGAIVVLRTPTSGKRDTNLVSYLEKLKKIAQEDQELIYIDQYTTMKQAYSLYSYLFNEFYLDASGMGLHPGPNGHLIMTRQFIEGCGLWTDDAHIPNLFYEVGMTEEANQTELPLMKAPDRIGLSVKALEKAAGKKIGSVTITATEKDGTKTYTTSTALGGDETILANMKHNTSYMVKVKAYLKDAKTVLTFPEKEVKLSDDMEADFSIILSNQKLYELAEGTEVGTLSVSSMAPEGTYTYELGGGETGNAFFKIVGDKLITAKKLEEKKTYSVSVKAKNGAIEKEQVFEIYAVGAGLIFEEKDVEITQGSVKDLTEESYAAEIKGLEEGTFIVQYTSTGTDNIQSLFSAANKDTGNGDRDRHFHIYIKKDGTLGYEIRNSGDFNLGSSAGNALKVTYKGKAAKNTIAFKADKEAGQYKLFANGKMVAVIDASNYNFIKNITGINCISLGATVRNGSNAYTFGGTIHDVRAYAVPLPDAELIKITGETSYDQLQQIFHSGDATGSNYFRIPAMLTTKKGTVIAAADARFGGTQDAPNNIDIAVSRSTDVGKTWEKAVMPLHFDDYADDSMTIPVGKDLKVNGSAALTNPQLLQERETGKIFLIANAVPSNTGISQAQTGNGYKTVNGKQYRMLKKNGEKDYNYSIHEDNFIYDDVNNQKTEYSVNEKFELLKNEELQTVKQKAVSYDPTGDGMIIERVTNTDVPMNIMYDTAEFTVFPTNYLYMATSEDDGKTWSAPIVLNDQVQTDSALLIGPGRGMQIEKGEHAGRLLIPVYKQSGCGVIYSDDKGDTWKFAAGPALGAGITMSESQIVEMPDGSLKLFARANAFKIAMATSLDGGSTWNESSYVAGLTQPACGSQISVLNYSKTVDKKPAVILSTPAGNGRNDGRVKVGLITETEAEGYGKYTVDWTYDYEINDPAAGFGYSCMTELPNGNIAILYEQYDSSANSQLQTKDAVRYEEISIRELCHKADYTKVDEAIAKADKIARASYTAESIAELNTALNAVVRDLAETEQSEVDAMAEAITKAIDGLEKKPYRVIVNGSTETVDGDYHYNDRITVTAKAPEDGKIFAGWQVEMQDGKKMILSTSRTYSFFVGSDLTLTAVYAEEVEEKASAYLQDVSAAKRADGKYDIRYLAQLVIPSGAPLTDAGLVWTNKADKVTAEQLKLDNVDKVGGVKATHITKISTTYQFSVTIKGVPENYTVPGKIFAVYKDQNGNPQTIYSEVKTGEAK